MNDQYLKQIANRLLWLNAILFCIAIGVAVIVGEVWTIAITFTQ